MENNIKLSKYADDLIEKFNNDYALNCNKVIEYLNKIIEKDLYNIGKSDNAVLVYNNLIGWLFKFFREELEESFKTIGYDYNMFKRYMIFCFIITFFRDEKRAHILYDSLKENNVVSRFLFYDEEKYELYTNDFGIISFYSINNYFNDNNVVLDKIKEMGTSIIDGCHEISEFLIKNDSSLYALTGILTNPLGEKIFHSVVLKDKMIIDIPNGIIMSYEDYMKLNDFEIISKYNYEKLIDIDNKCKKYDESNTLYPLLRCMLYKMYRSEGKNYE